MKLKIFHFIVLILFNPVLIAGEVEGMGDESGDRADRASDRDRAGSGDRDPGGNSEPGGRDPGSAADREGPRDQSRALETGRIEVPEPPPMRPEKNQPPEPIQAPPKNESNSQGGNNLIDRSPGDGGSQDHRDNPANSINSKPAGPSSSNSSPNQNESVGTPVSRIEQANRAKNLANIHGTNAINLMKQAMKAEEDGNTDLAITLFIESLEANQKANLNAEIAEAQLRFSKLENTNNSSNSEPETIAEKVAKQATKELITGSPGKLGRALGAAGAVFSSAELDTEGKGESVGSGLSLYELNLHRSLKEIENMKTFPDQEDP